MATIKYLEESQAQGKAKELYEGIKKALGLPQVPNAFKAMAHKPAFLEAMLSLNKAVMEEGVIPRKYKELIAIAVSAVNGCAY